MSDQDKPEIAGDAVDGSEYDAQKILWAYSPRDETQQPIRYLDGLDDPFVRDWLGGDATEAELHGLAGVPCGARVTVSGAGRACLAIAAIGQCEIINREGVETVARYQSLENVPLSARSGGKAAQVLKFHYCTSEPPRSGFGTDAIVRMVAACEKLGLESIEALLAGDGRDQTDNSSGYYAWAALGFDAELESWEDYQDRPLPDELKRMPGGKPVDSLQGLFRMPGGPLWWRQNGSTIGGVFRFANGSASRQQLQGALVKLAKERSIK